MKGLSKGRYDETFAGEDGIRWNFGLFLLLFFELVPK